MPSIPRYALRVLVVSSLLATSTFAQAPPGYYTSVDDSNAAALRATLHDVIDDHTRFPYTSVSTDTWDILEQADEDPADSGRILDVYRNRSFAKVGGGNPDYNREHTWPKSYGFPDDGSGNYPYTDCHQLMLCDDGYNSSRSNKPFRTCSAACSEMPTDANDGMGGTGGGYPGDSNWTTGSFTQGTWEVWSGRKGDIARAMFYLDLRYEGGSHGGSGHSEPDLILTDSEALIDASNTGSNEPVAYMGMLSVLLDWHIEDPVDQRERDRNDVVFSYQGNRNPFIDHPEWVDCLYMSVCGGGGDVTPPSAPSGLIATAGTNQVALDWNDNTEGDLAGYRVHRGTASGGPYTLLSGTLGTSDYVDTTALAGVTYHFVVTAVDTSSNESAFSNEDSAAPTGGGGAPVGDPWINELHYDNSGSDIGEFLEVAGPSGLDLTGWQIELYNGNGGGVYDTIALSGVLPHAAGCTGALVFAHAGIQNGAPDGFALIDPQGAVVQWQSYEGALTATGGAANGTTAVDIGVSESSSTPVGSSLQLGGSGAALADFTWQAALAETPGAVNQNQSFVAGGASTFGTGTPGSAGVPTICAHGGGGAWTVYGNDLGVGVTTVFLGSLGNSVPPLDLSNGLLLNVALPLFLVSPAIADGGGTASLALGVPAGASGITVHFQHVALDGTGGDVYASSPGLTVTLP